MIYRVESSRQNERTGGPYDMYSIYGSEATKKGYHKCLNAVGQRQ